MVSYPPGWKRPPDLDRAVRRNQIAQGIMSAGALEKQEMELERELAGRDLPKPKIEYWKRLLRGKRRRRRKGHHVWLIRRDPETKRFITRKRLEITGVIRAKDLKKPK